MTGAAFPSRAMVLAAGRGQRMRPLTDACPKPLLPVAGRTILDHSLDKLAAFGIAAVVVNCSYLGAQIIDHLVGRDVPPVILSPEDSPLETGGGVRNALDHLGDTPFFVINGDSLWIDGVKDTLHRLATAWDPERMDIQLLMQSMARVVGETARGDFLMDGDGRLTRRPEQEMASFCYTGVSIVHPRVFADCPDGAFSMNLLYDRAEAAGRLFGWAHDGPWYHLSNPDDLARAEAMFARGHRLDTPYL